MQQKEFNIMLDIKKKYQHEEIEVVQGDYDTNVFNIQLQNELNNYSLIDTNVEIAFAKPDGTTVLQDENTGVAIVNVAEGRIRCVLNTNTIASPGKVLSEVRVLNIDGKLLTSARFNFFVRKSIVNDETVESTNEFPVLNQLITTTQGLIKQVEQIEAQVPENVVTELNQVSTLANQLQQDLIAHKAEKASQEAVGHIRLPESWREISLLNGWVKNTYARFCKDEFGFVHCEGYIKDGVTTNGTILFKLPVGYRPDIYFFINNAGQITNKSTDGSIRLEITTGGDVKLSPLLEYDSFIFNFSFRGGN